MRTDVKPIIGIVGRPDSFNNTTMIKVNDSYRNAIISCGGIPILILPTQTIKYGSSYPRQILSMTDENKRDLVEVLNLCDGIIMPGGKEIFEYDRFICDYCIRCNKPVLGICLGMQIMSYYNREYSLLENDEGGLNHSNNIHNISIKPDTLLHMIINRTNIMVNSRHKYHCDSIGDYIVSALSQDGLIEAIEYPYNTFNIGVEWHPEDLINDVSNRNILIEFIIEAVNYRYTNKRP